MTPSQTALLLRSLSGVLRTGQSVGSGLGDNDDLLGKTGLSALSGRSAAIKAAGVVTIVTVGAAMAVFTRRLSSFVDDIEDDVDELTTLDDQEIVDDFLKSIGVDETITGDRSSNSKKAVKTERDLAAEALSDVKDSHVAPSPPSQAAGSPERAPSSTAIRRSDLVTEMKERYDQLRSKLPSSVSSTSTTPGSVVSVGRRVSVLVPQTEVLDDIRLASRLSGLPLDLMLAVANVESKFSPDVGATSGGTAKGLYQFLEGTWGDMIKRYGKSPEMIQLFGKKGVTSDMVTDSRANAIMGGYFIRDNLKVLEKNGYPTGSREAYMSHFLGVTGAMTMLDRIKKRPDDIAADDYGGTKKGTVSGRNIGIFYATGPKKTLIARTYAEVGAHLAHAVSSQSYYQEMISGKYGGLGGNREAVTAYGNTVDVKDIYRNKKGELSYGKEALAEELREKKEAEAAKKAAKKSSSSNAKSSTSNSRSDVSAAQPKPASAAKPVSVKVSSSEGALQTSPTNPTPMNILRAPNGALVYG